MRPSRPGLLTGLGFLAAVLAWSGLQVWVSSGHAEPDLMWRTTLTIGLLAVAVFGVGWPVKQWVDGDKARRIDALRAARTAALAKAASVAGALLVGVFLGWTVHYLPTLHIAARRSETVVAVADVVVSVLLLVAGLLVERWCRVPPDEDEQTGARA
ncbi:DUF3180 domain-containing protein [Kineococcus rhizosphaerae]|uniref:Uncharacterized protein DUF3180 n=1 Tax=Kineococcus rhizosphaerae TaxID=559628 RepID=A0A2T0R5J3_9ACTN|nr:DUF3180 domain-containing protein [Kineococcus rhizosphaerae]PRY16038.1 uncharacterized protein DUF3180 [Kineococcus rhizosphaerae]